MGYENWLWRLRENGRETGPFTYGELQRRYAVREIDGDTEACPKKLFAGWARLNFFFPDFKGKSPSTLGASEFSEPSDQSTTTERLLQTVIANQQEQIRLLSAIRWGIVGFAIWFIIQFWILPMVLASFR
ncbi:MAG: hypothetical protein HY043_23670 [Verrucomicrobia bacterium]|nr:hypothetical protein [Verrucomicrobiota bacterium]